MNLIFTGFNFLDNIPFISKNKRFEIFKNLFSHLNILLYIQRCSELQYVPFKVCVCKFIHHYIWFYILKSLLKNHNTFDSNAYAIFKIKAKIYISVQLITVIITITVNKI